MLAEQVREKSFQEVANKDCRVTKVRFHVEKILSCILVQVNRTMQKEVTKRDEIFFSAKISFCAWEILVFQFFDNNTFPRSIWPDPKQHLDPQN